MLCRTKPPGHLFDRMVIHVVKLTWEKLINMLKLIISPKLGDVPSEARGQHALIKAFLRETARRLQELGGRQRAHNVLIVGVPVGVQLVQHVFGVQLVKQPVNEGPAEGHLGLALVLAQLQQIPLGVR
jgi:hypothetical protein